MTNFEYLKNLDIERCADFISSYIIDENYCELCIHKQDKCISCIEDWLKKEHKNDMPELTSGTFVLVNYNFYSVEKLGVIIDNDIYGKLVIYKDGTWEKLKNIKDGIIKIYHKNVLCFDNCGEHTVIWSKE